jgi:serine/threonine-protein kinase
MAKPKISFIPHEELYRGGMAVLRLATGEQDGQKYVLREMLPSTALSWRKRSGFKRGCVIRAKLSPHPHIVRSIDYGVRRCKPYELIEYVPGPSLRQMINDEAELVLAHGFELVRQTAEALAHVHDLGWMHLDVKPENFIIYKERGRLHAKLTDFDLTTEGRELRMAKPPGTLVYAAPELLKEGFVSPAADIFAFGVMAYRLLTGHMPFQGNSEKKSRWRQMNEGYKPKAPAELVPGLSNKLSTLVMQCLAKDPQDRFPSMVLLRQQLAGA